jgi:hypothetical protein
MTLVAKFVVVFFCMVDHVSSLTIDQLTPKALEAAIGLKLNHPNGTPEEYAAFFLKYGSVLEQVMDIEFEYINTKDAEEDCSKAENSNLLGCQTLENCTTGAAKDLPKCTDPDCALNENRFLPKCMDEKCELPIMAQRIDTCKEWCKTSDNCDAGTSDNTPTDDQTSDNTPTDDQTSDNTPTDDQTSDNTPTDNDVPEITTTISPPSENTPTDDQVTTEASEYSDWEDQGVVFTTTKESVDDINKQLKEVFGEKEAVANAVGTSTSPALFCVAAVLFSV